MRAFLLIAGFSILCGCTNEFMITCKKACEPNGIFFVHYNSSTCICNSITEAKQKCLLQVEEHVMEEARK